MSNGKAMTRRIVQGAPTYSELEPEDAGRMNDAGAQVQTPVTGLSQQKEDALALGQVGFEG